MTPNEHLSAGEMAAYIDRSLTQDACERAEQHLSDCSLCRDDLAASARIVANAPTPFRRRLIAPVIGAAAAVIIVAVALEVPRHPPTRASTTERGSDLGAQRIVLVTPRDGASISSKGVRFVWRADSGAVGYRIIVTTANGTPVWRGDAGDTTVAPPREVAFANGGDFAWRVESSRPDGGGAVSPTATFRVVSR